jgi:FkbH-like protein
MAWRDMLDFPFDPNEILQKKKSIRRHLLQKQDFSEIRIAILGGSTTDEIKNILELFLLNESIRPVFYESGYNKCFEDVLFENPDLISFKPQIVYVHTSNVNILHVPEISDSDTEIQQKLRNEFNRFICLWEKTKVLFACPIIQNNFELPQTRALGNLDFSDPRGMVHYITRLNKELAAYAASNKGFYINDINYLSSWLGLSKWHDKTFWYSSKYACNYEAIPYISHNLSRIITAIMGKSKKCLVLDLDNTLWGGVIGEDGMEKICIGNETAIGEAYSGFQKYLKGLKDRGVMLAVCSKNDPDTALEGLSHPDNILKPEDFLIIKAGWQDKHLSLREISHDLNIGLDSMVFIDDNPAEREIVKAQLPEVLVPDIGSDVVFFPEIIDRSGYFEQANISGEDLERTKYYVENAHRSDSLSKFKDYNEFLISLEMKAEITDFKPVHLDRIAQLTNKTNQFNLTTRRYSLDEIEAISKDNRYIRLCGKLQDKFGDNGLVSVIIGQIDGACLHIDLWIMSCRVIKRNLEFAMFDNLVDVCKKREIKQIIGTYIPTKKNNLVASHYSLLGFSNVSAQENGTTTWNIEINNGIRKLNNILEVKND